MRFSWDPKKATANLKNLCVSFVETATFFRDRPSVMGGSRPFYLGAPLRRAQKAAQPAAPKSGAPVSGKARRQNLLLEM